MIQLNDFVQFVVIRQQADFDRACDSAYDLAKVHLGVDENGDCKNVEGWSRKSCWVEVEFVSLCSTYSPVGQEHVYKFVTRAKTGGRR